MKDIILDYDTGSPDSIEQYAKRLLGKTFREVSDEDDGKGVFIVDPNYNASHGNIRRKGSLGELIEEKFFHYKCNNDSRPDFPDAGVELKVTPYKKNKNGSLSAKERLVITMIDYCSVVNERFEESHLWNKAGRILLVYYLYSKDVSDKLDYQIKFAQIFTPPAKDLLIIKQDYEKIINKIREGKAHELSESDTLYLSASTKGADSSDRREQPYSKTPAKPRAFSFKNSYMTYVLNEYIVPGKKRCEQIMNDDANVDFEVFIKNKIDEYKGCTVVDLCSKFKIDYEKPPKNFGAVLAYRILGIKGNKAEEFEKANIVTKTIRIEKNNRVKESMSFPTFKFTELVEEKWDDSTFGNYLRETRFFFVVYKYNEKDELVLQGCQFWNIPKKDLDEVKKVWNETVRVLKSGLIVTDKNGTKSNNFPSASENSVCHVRPHGRNAQDTYPLPKAPGSTLREYTKQSFWLNNSYIYDQIDNELK